MASYMDMVTVLMCMFIVLFAMSTVDANKFEKLRNSLATGFGAVASETVDTASGTVVPPELVDENLEAFAAVKGAATTSPENMAEAIKEVDKLKALQAKMQSGLAAAGLSDNVEFQIDQRGLTVKLVGSQAFFEPDQPELTSRATQVLQIISPILKPAGMEIMVEGHAANGITAYPSTWELSSARAVNVLRFMVDRGGIAPGNHRRRRIRVRPPGQRRLHPGVDGAEPPGGHRGPFRQARRRPCADSRGIEAEQEIGCSLPAVFAGGLPPRIA